MRNRLLFAVLALAVSATACTSFEHKSSLSSPSPIAPGALMGVWTSSTIIPTPSSCTDFKWTVSEQTATSASGSFTATCAGDLKLTGTAQGNFLSSTQIGWKAQGSATAPGLTPSPCPITLTGTAELGVDTIRVPYSGDTCLGKVSGIESLKKR